MAGLLLGGRVERFGAAVLACDYALTGLVAGTAAAEAIAAVSTGVIALVFIALAFRSDRWWPFVTAASLTLFIVVYFLEWVTGDVPRYAAQSARLGLWIVVYLSLIVGVAERWLAGDGPGQGVAVRRRRRATP